MSLEHDLQQEQVNNLDLNNFTTVEIGTSVKSTIEQTRAENHHCAFIVDDKGSLIGILDHTRTRQYPFGRRTRLGLDRRQLGDELVGCHTDRASELEFGSHVGPDALRDLGAFTEQADRTADVEERLVQRQRLQPVGPRLVDRD